MVKKLSGMCEPLKKIFFKLKSTFSFLHFYLGFSCSQFFCFKGFVLFCFTFPFIQRLVSLPHWVSHRSTLRSLALLTSLPICLSVIWNLGKNSCCQPLLSLWIFSTSVSPGDDSKTQLSSEKQHRASWRILLTRFFYTVLQGSLLGLGNAFHLPTACSE